MNRAIKYRIYPTNEQISLIIRTFGCCRKVYNLMLAEKLDSYQKTGRFDSKTPAGYKEEYPFLKEVDSQALDSAKLNLQAAFRNHFDKKRKKQTGFPKFKSKKNSRRSYTTHNIKAKNGTYSIRITEKGIRLPKLGIVKTEFHRLPEDDWKLKSVTVSQDGDGKFYASVLFEFEKEIEPVPVSENALGLDYASDGLYVDDQGNRGSVDNKYYRKQQVKLRREQRRLSRKKGNAKGEKCSHNYWKQLRKLNKVHCRIRNQRKDFLHKKSAEIANQYDVVCVETLNMKAIANKGFGNGKATMDNGYGMFLTFLQYKLEERGKYFVKVGKWFPSSQICHECGTRHPEMKNLQIRTMKCECGNIMSRDQNAALNIKTEGLRMLRASL